MKIKKHLSVIYHQYIDNVNIFLYTLFGEKKRSEKIIKSLQNKFKGKRGFVICNGPSLRIEDLDKLNEHAEISISMNLIGRCFGETKWRPNLLLASDPVCVMNQNLGIVSNTETELKLCSAKLYLKSLKIKGKKLFYNYDGSFELLDSPKFTIDMNKTIYSIGTSTFGAIEWLHYLGCNEIYLLGCDMGYSVNQRRDGTIWYNNTNKEHFYLQSDGVLDNIKAKPIPTWQLEIAYECAEKASRKHGFRIYNATRGGYLEIFERVDFDSLFKKEEDNNSQN